MDDKIDETNVNEKNIDDFSIDYQLIKPYRSQVGKSSALRRFFCARGQLPAGDFIALYRGMFIKKSKS